MAAMIDLDSSNSNIPQCTNMLSQHNRLVPPVSCAALVNTTSVSRHLHTTPKRHGLSEFFDDEESWGSAKGDFGRPWKKDELRLKSNQELHQLWYILLKERNMVMTMHEIYKAEGEVFPGPDRVEKVEESMENLLDVVAERDRAYHLLETGETGDQGRRWIVDELGRGRWRRNTEHIEPLHENDEWRDSEKPRQTEWAVGYKKLYREARQKEKDVRAAKEEKHERMRDTLLPDEQLQDS